MTLKTSIVATVAIIAVASLVTGLQQVYVAEHPRSVAAQPLELVLGETDPAPELAQPETIEPKPAASIQTLPTLLVNISPENANTLGETPTVALQLCRDHPGSRLWACNARGLNYYAVTANQFTVDAPMEIYDVDGSYRISCGGMMVFTDEAARQENAAQCQQYHLNDCREITSLCQSL